jgi:GrpB-like predicted nucleotidyltransferase (UPF0157 family)
MPGPIRIVDYDPDWPEHFEVIRVPVAEVLGSLAATIEHVGSTAVPGLAAKPIIDLDVLLADESALPAAIERLATLGYVHQGDLGIAEREAFLTPPSTIPHHLYVCPPHSEAYRRHLAFRDYLCDCPDAAAAYGELKRSLALQFGDNWSAYTNAKSAFIEDILKRAADR